jgi:DUF917 family protein
MCNKYVDFKFKLLSEVKYHNELIMIENKNKIYLMFTLLIEIINKKVNK